MLSRLLLIYAVVELAVIFALVSTIGWGWTLLALLAAFVLGWGILAPVASSHLIRRIGQLRSGLTDPRSAAGDGALVTLSAVLVLIPGLVSTALGLLLLVPPIRSVAGPRLTAVAVNKLQRRGVSYATAFPPDSYVQPGAGHRDYIDGEVIDVHDVEPSAWPEPRTERLNGR
jgi:UPF0716 protein FxsA